MSSSSVQNPQSSTTQDKQCIFANVLTRYDLRFERAGVEHTAKLPNTRRQLGGNYSCGCICKFRGHQRWDISNVNDAPCVLVS